jgi:hypothetical protein
VSFVKPLTVLELSVHPERRRFNTSVKGDQGEDQIVEAAFIITETRRRVLALLHPGITSFLDQLVTNHLNPVRPFGDLDENSSTAEDIDQQIHRLQELHCMARRAQRSVCRASRQGLHPAYHEALKVILECESAERKLMQIRDCALTGELEDLFLRKKLLYQM